MQKFFFSKFSPSGNTTLFLHGRAPKAPEDCAHFCREALGACGIGAEQAAFADIGGRSVTMGAGEFCLNACRAFGALIDLATSGNNDAPRGYSMRISGLDAPVRLQVCGRAPEWHVSAAFQPGECPMEGNLEERLLVALPGISHLLIQAAEFPPAGLARTMAAQLRKEYQLEKLAASGVVWWRETGGSFDIWPFVHVSDSGTSMLESSCGSATVSLALAMGKNSDCEKFVIRQPCGETLETAIEGNSICLGGNVSLCAMGEVWLPVPKAIRYEDEETAPA